jgi:hypothetical protein
MSAASELGGKFLGVKSIDASKEDMESLRQVLDSKVSDCVKTLKIKKVLGSWCILCGGIPTKIATYDYIDAIKIERYCDSCAVTLEKQFSSV